MKKQLMKELKQIYVKQSQKYIVYPLTTKSET